MTRQALPPSRRPQRGFTLVELMVAMALGIVLTGVMVGAFLATKQSYRVQIGMSRTQEGGHFALEFLARDIRMAGFAGSCLARGDGVVNTLNGGYAANFGVGLEAYEASGAAWSPSLDTSISAQAPSAGSDILTIRLAGDGLPVDTPYMPNTSADVHVPSGNRLLQNQIAVICDPGHAAVFQITNANPGTSGSVVHNTGAVSSGPGNATKDFEHKFAANSELFAFSTHTYYVAPSASGVGASLWMLASPCPAGNICPVELAENVERLQLEYGIDTDGDTLRSANQFVDASAVGDWNQVVAVRVGVLAHSSEIGLRTAPASVTFNGVTTASDTSLRRVYSSVVTLRSRVP